MMVFFERIRVSVCVTGGDMQKRVFVWHSALFRRMQRCRLNFQALIFGSVSFLVTPGPQVCFIAKDLVGVGVGTSFLPATL